MMSVQGEPDYLRRAMLAGAREFLVKPFSSRRAVGVDPPGPPARAPEARPRRAACRARQRDQRPRRASPRAATGRVVTFFSPKGGVGRTTLAVNFAVAAATELGKRVALVDGGLQFGDVGVLLNLNPKNQSIADVAREMAERRPRDARDDARRPQHRRARADGAAQPGDGRAGHARSHVTHHRRAAPDARPGGHRLDAAPPGRDAGLPRSVGRRS